MSRIIIRAGYDFTRKFVFRLDGTAENLSTATIKAALKNDAKTAVLIAAVTQSSGTTGADWTNGIIVLTFTAASTTGLTAQKAWLEVQVTLGGLKLPYEDVPIQVELGNIP